MPKNFFKNTILWTVFLILLYYYIIFIGVVFTRIDWSEIYQLWVYDKDYDLVYKIFWQAIIKEIIFWNKECWWWYTSLILKITPLITKLIPYWSHIWMLKEDIKNFSIGFYQYLYTTLRLFYFIFFKHIPKSFLKKWGLEKEPRIPGRYFFAASPIRETFKRIRKFRF